MRKIVLPLVLLAVFAAQPASGQSDTTEGPLPPPDMTLTRASTVIHPDDTKTITLYDAEKRQSDVQYINADGSFRAHVIYSMDESNRIKSGQFILKNGKPGLRALYRYNEDNRVIEESHYDLKGQLVRRMTYEYGLTDRVMKTVAYDAAGNVIGVYVPKRHPLPQH